MSTITVSRKTLWLAGLVIALGLTAALVVTSLPHGAARANGDQTPTPTETVAAVDTVAARKAAAAGTLEAMRFEGAEGRAGWEARVEPLCTATGWRFWQLIAAQTWPQIEAESITVSETHLVDAETLEVTEEGHVIVAVTIESTVEHADGTTTDRSTNQMVMVEQDGAWLMDGPPFDPRGK